VDNASALLAKVFEAELGAQERTAKIGIHNPIPVVSLCVRDSASDGDAGAVKEDIDGAEVLRGTSYTLAKLNLFCHVTSPGDSVSARLTDLGGNSFSAWQIAIENRYVGAFDGEQPGCGRADARSTTRYYCMFSHQTHDERPWRIHRF
jgi:hypothetical protein